MILLACAPAEADLLEFEGDRDGWIEAAGDIATTDFTGHPDGTVITEQFVASWGDKEVNIGDLLEILARWGDCRP